MTQDNASKKQTKFYKSSIFTHILVAVITGIISLGGTFLMSKSNEKIGTYQSDNEMIVRLIGKVNELQEQSQSVQRENKKLSEEIISLKAEINQLRSLKNYDEFAISSFFRFMPLPAWLKVYDNSEGEFIMKKINRAYEIQWDVNNIQYAGHPDYIIWDKVTADEFKLHDNAVRDNLKPIITIETIPNDSHDLSKGRTEWIVAKFPVSLNGTTYDAVGGIAIPEKIREYINFPKLTAEEVEAKVVEPSPAVGPVEIDP